MRFLFTATIFLGSLLLFLVQPMVAKMVLPKFGGSPGVWSASLVFFQGALLLGYLYAHLSNRWLGPRRQPFLHLAVLALPLALLPIGLAAGYAPSPTGNHSLGVVWLLCTLVGAPFFVVSAGAPLLQRWFGATSDPKAHDPYFLYAASNLGSLLALLAYPLLLEPTYRLAEQSRLWTVGYWGLAALVAACGIATIAAARGSVAEKESQTDRPAPTARDRFRWVALSAVPSSLLLGVTSYLTGNLAPVPLLWVVPLALYLLTFIVAFSERRSPSSAVWGRALPLLLTPLSLALLLEATSPLFALAAFHLAVFVVAALMCHKRLSESRPGVHHLTEFYLWISVGGVLGGAFNGLVAPVAFNSLVEYPAALIAAALLVPRRTGLSLKATLLWAALPAAVCAALVAIALAAGMPPSPARTALTMGLPLVVAFLGADDARRYGLGMAGVFVAAWITGAASDGRILVSDRSFFGVHRVIESGRQVQLVHGNTIHGIQDRDRPSEPLTYYSRSGPVGQLLSGDRRFKSVALVGLGVGSIAAYGEPGDKYTYFEIDPVVEQLAKDERYFTFLKDTRADLGVVLGDARLTLALEPNSSYDLVILDAFSSDSIPAHLLTREALEVYRSKLMPGGLVAVHISNRYLDIAPTLAATARELGWNAFLNEDEATTDEADAGKRSSRWMVLAEGDPELDLRWDPIEDPKGEVWTDDYTNILRSLRWSELLPFSSEP